MLFGLPILGVALAGKPLEQFLEFPPITRYVNHPPFSWGYFTSGFFILAILLAPVLFRALRYEKTRQSDSVGRGMGRFPWWGFAALAGGVTSWVLAWTRFSWFESLQIHTFTPLWVSYIIFVNAYTYKRSGKCMLTSNRTYFFVLFPASMVFWWVFEYLNRFVQNWYYLGGTGLTASEYILYASISFSTVLPAVLSTRDLLLTFPFFRECFTDYIVVRPSYPKIFACIAFLITAIGLASLGTEPEYTYSLLWVSPLITIVSLQTVFGETHVLTGIRDGDWTLVISSSVAALICGFFWEMWNFHSLSKWIYSIPYVHRFMIFEMPILGYAGYLPFGILCLAAGKIIKYDKHDNREE
jgi:hypothetical protein